MAGGKQDPRRLCLKFEQWPREDQHLWLQATAPRPASFKARPYAQSLSTASIKKAQEGFSRYLGFIAYTEPALLQQPMAERVTRQNAERFLTLLQEVGNADHTIVGRFQELQTALRIMLPAGEWAWLTNPDGFSLRCSFRMQRRPMVPHHPRVLRDWALELMTTPPGHHTQMKADVRFRDGLMLALLASRAPRLRSLRVMEIGQHLIVTDDGFQLVFEWDDMKNKRPLHYDLPDVLVGPMRRYLREVRPRLLQGQNHNALWVDITGAALKETQIKTMVRLRSGMKFEKPFGHLEKPPTFRAFMIRLDRADVRRQRWANPVCLILSSGISAFPRLVIPWSNSHH